MKRNPSRGPELDSRPIRNNLTDRECSHLLGSTIGVLVNLAPVANVKRALAWWAANVELLEVMAEQSRDVDQVAENMVATFKRRHKD